MCELEREACLGIPTSLDGLGTILLMTGFVIMSDDLFLCVSYCLYSIVRAGLGSLVYTESIKLVFRIR